MTNFKKTMIVGASLTALQFNYALQAQSAMAVAVKTEAVDLVSDEQPEAAPAVEAAPQQAAPQQAAKPQYSREDMEAIIAEQEKLVQSMMGDFMKLHIEAEDYMLKVVEYVSQLKDSGDSKTRVARLKKHIMSDLQSGIREIQNSRGVAMQELAILPEDYQEGSSQQAVKDLSEEMINTRLEAIMTMANSLHQHNDVAKYENYTKSSYRSNVRVKRRVSDEYKEERLQGQNAEQTKKELFENLDKVKFNVKNDIGYMEAEQHRAAGTPLATQYEEEIAQKKEMLKLLDEHIYELKNNPSPATQSVGSLNDAMRLEQDVYQAVQNLTDANNRLRQKGMALRQQIDLLNAQKVTLQRTIDQQP